MSPNSVHTFKPQQGMKSFKVKTVPNRSDKQNVTAKTRARKLYSEYLTKFSCVIMDDETYVLKDFKQLPEICFYTVMQRNGVEEHFRTKKKAKFPKNIWFGRQYAAVVEQAKASSLPERLTRKYKVNNA